MGGEGAHPQAMSPLAAAHTAGLTALVMILAGCATGSPQGMADRPDTPAPSSLEARLQALAEKYAVAEQPARDPAQIRAQIANLEARRLRLLERYTPAHPSVLQIDRQIRTLQAQLAQAEAAQAATTPPAP